jgi:hypothetical protein
MSSRKSRVAGLFALVLVSTSTARAQIPAIPGAAGGASSAASGLAAAGPAASAAPAAASPTTLWSFLGLSSSNLQACRAKLCASQVGQMLNSTATGPLAAMTGGFIPALCPPAPNASQIAALNAKAPGGAQATAAKIQASEADAKARVAAVEYLGTVDCTRWKEATTALKSALRADPNECVRYAAARALNSGCCCNKDTMDALKVCVSGDTSDGNPPETSPRVKAAAFNALQNCLMRVPEVLPEEPLPKPIPRERGPNLEPVPGQPIERERTSMNASAGSHVAASHVVPRPAPTRFEEELQRKTYAQTVNEARQTLIEVARNPNQSPTLPPGKKSVIDLLRKARHDMDSKARASAPPPPGPVPSDPGVVPTSYSPGAQINQGQAVILQASASTRVPSGPAPSGDVSSTDSAQSSRGLIGLLFNSRR